jgi:hypothetical protein
VPVNRNGTAGSESSLPAARWDARRPGRITLIAGTVRGVPCIAVGALQSSRGHGIVILTPGCVLTLFRLAIIPGGRRSGKR